jgi:ABC-type nitrate/sulfonate/bicarbonate transport system permease component
MEKKIRKSINMKNIFYSSFSFLSILVLIILWISASKVNAELVPTPYMVGERVIQMFVKEISKLTLIGHILVSIRRVLVALAFSITVGVSLGVMIGWNKTFRLTIGTLFEIIRPIPPIAWLPIIIMSFGIGEFPKVLLVAIGTLMPIVINTYTGIRLVDPLNLDVGRVFNATEKQLLFEIAIPSAFPAIFAGIKNAIGVGWMVVLAAEMIGAKAGVGFLIIRGMEFFDVPLIMVGMISIGGVGAALSYGLDAIERRVVPWHQTLG